MHGGIRPSNGGMSCRLVGSSSFLLVLKREEYGGRPRESSFGIASRWRMMIEISISITGLPQGSRGRGLILSLYWLLGVAPKSVL